MRGDLPAGTVSFVFTDIEGSTRLLHEIGSEAYAAALQKHRMALRDAFGGHGGVEVDTQGDAFFYAFPTAPGAVAAADEGQRALRKDGDIRVRMGVHTGTPVLTDEGYVGTDVHRAARIAAVAHGGQVVLSATTAGLSERTDLVDLGLHRLKDLSTPEHIYQVGDEAFPPLRSLYRTNLPVPATPFQGREAESERVLELLMAPTTRLLTLTGAGGSGKTRLAMHVAAQGSDGFPQGVYWVPLSGVIDPDIVETAVGGALGADSDVAAWIGDKRLLLLLDNFEQVLDAADRLASWLTRCPQLRMLVTSREPLRLSAERQYPVPTLSAADGRELFAARARSFDPGFQPDASVDELCRQLDNLPLAIELAAARLKVLGTGQLLVRLSERLQLLRTTTRDAPERQRSLRATIDWSHDLLQPTEQSAFRRLAVFVDGCTLDAAEAVADADIDTLESLVDKSLVRRTGDRYWMLATIREYAAERLEHDDDAQALRRRHAEYFAEVADSAHLSVETMDLGQDHRIVGPEIANLRAAMDWAQSVGDWVLAVSIAVSLEQFWVIRSPVEGSSRLTSLLAHADGLPARLHARAVRCLGGATFIGGDFDAGSALHRNAMEMFQRLGDDEAVAHLALRLGMAALNDGDFEYVRALLDDDARRPSTRTDQCQWIALRAHLAMKEGRGDDALELMLESADMAAETNFLWWQQGMLFHHAEAAIALQRPELAARSLPEALRLAREIGYRQGSAYALALLAQLAAETGDDEAAGRWWGATTAEAEREPIGQWEQDRDSLAETVVRNTAEFEAGVRAGRLLSFDQATELALHGAGAIPPDR